MVNDYSIEIDFLPVGEKSRSGDAIAIRFGLYERDSWSNQTIFVIDGGDSNSGQEMVSHIKNVYKSDKIDRIFLTHPDGDHACGLKHVIEELEVGKIWMHRPWNYWSDLKDAIVDGRVTKKSFTERLREAYQHAHDIEQLAIKKKIQIIHPHQGKTISIGDQIILTLLSPGKDLYLDLVKSSDKNTHLESINKMYKSLMVNESKKTAFEDMSFETEHLPENEVATSEENNMSLVLFLNVAGKKFLFTGDSGTRNLFEAIRFANLKNINLKDLAVFKVPHHGSKHNLSKGILKHINAEYAIISCSKLGEPKHPNSIVTNSLIRRNMPPYSTQGSLINYHHGEVPQRENLRPIMPISFSDYVEITVE